MSEISSQKIVSALSHGRHIFPESARRASAMGKKHKVLCSLPFAGLFFGRPTWPFRRPIFSALPSALPLFRRVRRGIVLPQRVADEVAQLGGDLAADGLRDEPEPAVEER